MNSRGTCVNPGSHDGGLRTPSGRGDGGLRTPSGRGDGEHQDFCHIRSRTPVLQLVVAVIVMNSADTGHCEYY
jgi:hypothetical protein